MKSHTHTDSGHQTLKGRAKDDAKFACIEQRYGVTSEQIRRVIGLVGNSPDKVEEYLKRKLFSFLSYTHN